MRKLGLLRGIFFSGYFSCPVSAACLLASAGSGGVFCYCLRGLAASGALAQADASCRRGTGAGPGVELAVCPGSPVAYGGTGRAGAAGDHDAVCLSLGHGLRCQGHPFASKGFPSERLCITGIRPFWNCVRARLLWIRCCCAAPEPSRDDDITTFTSKGIFLLATSRGTPEAKAGSVGSPRWWPAELGRAMQLRIARLFTGDTAAFLTAILTGERNGLSVRADSDLSEAGLSHILAVSGMHCMFLLRMIQDVTGKHRRRLVAGWGIPVLAFYALLTGGSPSVVRACVMVVFYLTAPLFGRDSDGPTALTSALFCILLVNPFAVASISLQLSFGAMAGLLWVSDRLYRMLAGQGKHGKIFCFTASSISASVGSIGIYLAPGGVLFRHAGAGVSAEQFAVPLGG